MNKLGNKTAPPPPRGGTKGGPSSMDRKKQGRNMSRANNQRSGGKG